MIQCKKQIGWAYEKRSLGRGVTESNLALSRPCFKHDRCTYSMSCTTQGSCQCWQWNVIASACPWRGRSGEPGDVNEIVRCWAYVSSRSPAAMFHALQAGVILPESCQCEHGMLLHQLVYGECITVKDSVSNWPSKCTKLKFDTSI
jgi:hypothetical protein